MTENSCLIGERFRTDTGEELTIKQAIARRVRGVKVAYFRFCDGSQLELWELRTFLITGIFTPQTPALSEFVEAAKAWDKAYNAN